MKKVFCFGLLSFFFLFLTESASAKVSSPKKTVVSAWNIADMQKKAQEYMSLSRYRGLFQQRGLSLSLRLSPEFGHGKQVLVSSSVAVSRKGKSSKKEPNHRPFVRATKKVSSGKKTQSNPTSKDCNALCKQLIAKRLLEAAKDFYRVKHTDIAYRYALRIAKKYSGTPAANRAYLLALKWRKELLSHLDQSGRIEFIVFSGLYGLTLGFLAPAVFQIGNSFAEPYVFGLSALAVTTFALTASILLTKKAELTEGMASLNWNATLWGAWNFLAVSLIAGANNSNSLRLPVIGSLIGYGIGLVVGKLTNPSPGLGFLAGSVGGWMLAYTAAILGVIGANNGSLSIRAAFTSLLVVSDLGFILGAFLQPVLRLSRSRILLLNLGAAIGGGIGVGIGLLFLNALSGSTAVTVTLLSSVLLSMGGIAITYYLTRNMASERKTRRFASGALFHLRKGKWSVDLPVPMIMPAMVNAGAGDVSGIQVSVPIATGSW